MNSCDRTWRNEKLNKSCRNHINWDGTAIVLHHLLVMLIEKTVLSTCKRVCNFCKILQSLSNAHPSHCWVTCWQQQKCHCEELERSLRGMYQSSGTWETGYHWLIICWGETLSILDILFNSTKLVNWFYWIRMSSLTCSGGKVMFSSSLVGSAANSG